MQTTGKRKRDRYKTGNHSATHSKKSRILALIGSVAFSLVIMIYLMSAAYPSRLFSKKAAPEIKNPETVAKPAFVYLPVPNSAVKIGSEALFASNNSVWAKIFAEAGKKYKAPALQFYQDTISAYQCRLVLPATGVFYCPADKAIFIDVAFLDTIKHRFPASARLVQTYIIAHQQGHHIAALLGITAKMDAERAQLTDPAAIQQLDDQEELVADYYAGVWMHHAWKAGFDSGDAETAVSYVTQLSTALARNNEIALPDPYTYKTLGARAQSLYRGYQEGTLKGVNELLK